MATTIPTLPDVPNRVTGRATYSADSDAFNAALPAWTTAANTLGGEVEAWYNQVNTWQSTVGTNYTQIQTWKDEAQDAATNAGTAQTASEDAQALSEAAKLLSQAAATISAAEATNSANTAATVVAAWESVTALNDNAHLHTIAAVQGLQAALDSKADGAATTDALALKAPQTDVNAKDAAQAEALRLSLTWVALTGAATLEVGKRYRADVSGGAFTATLPASPSAGDAVTVKIINGDPFANPLTLSGDIMGDTSLVLSAAYYQIELIFDGTEWRL